MATKRYLVKGDDNDQYLEAVGSDSFVAEGTKILRVVQTNGDEDLIYLDRTGEWAHRDGLLRLKGWENGNVLRIYRGWSYVEVVPYKAPAVPQVF